MVELNDWRTVIKTSRELRAQRQCQSAERRIVLDDLIWQSSERLERQKQGRRSRNPTSSQSGGKIFTVEEIRQFNQCIRESLDRVAQTLLRVETSLSSAEHSFNRAALRLEKAEEHLAHADGGIEQLSSYEVEQRIHAEQMSPPPRIAAIFALIKRACFRCAQPAYLSRFLTQNPRAF